LLRFGFECLSEFGRDISETLFLVRGIPQELYDEAKHLKPVLYLVKPDSAEPLIVFFSKFDL
jgi:hypothetical protein